MQKGCKVWDFIFYQHIISSTISTEKSFQNLRKEIQSLYLLIREKEGLLEGLPRERESGIFIPLREAEGGMWSRNESA